MVSLAHELKMSPEQQADESSQSEQDDQKATPREPQGAEKGSGRLPHDLIDIKNDFEKVKELYLELS